MAGAGTPIILIVILVMIVLGGNFIVTTGLTPSSPTSSTTTTTTTTISNGVKLHGGHYMEIVKEETCSNRVIRMTCRSLRASILVLEADYMRNRTNVCSEYEKGGEDEEEENSVDRRRWFENFEEKNRKYLKGNYVDDDVAKDNDIADLRMSMNRRCSGLQHCRFNVNSDHPEAAFWKAANVRLKYACIPEAAIGRYCNTKITVPGGEGGYLKSPGYPHYYPGGTSCGWTFKSLKGQRISLTFHDLNIRNPEQDGSCIDVVRVREHGMTLLESCGTAAGLEILSASNVVTLDLIALGNLYPSRGFLLQYQAIGCPDFEPPIGSYVVNDTDRYKTLFCKSGSVFTDTKKRSKSMVCINGIWNSSSRLQAGCVDSSAAILKAERESGRFNSLSEEGGGTVYVPAYGVGERSYDANANANSAMPASVSGSTSVSDSDPIETMKGDYDIVNVVLPTVLIALLFIGNAIIVYVIFQYRKRKQPAFGEQIGEEMALRGPESLPQV